MNKVRKLQNPTVRLETVTPSNDQKQGGPLEILYGWHPTPFGSCLIGLTKRGICYLSFLNQKDSESRKSSLQEFKRIWSHATFNCDPRKTQKAISRLFRPSGVSHKTEIPVLVMGTPFQIKVWEAILRIPPGKVLSYQQVARLAGQPKAARAVGSALANNSVGYLIPCHRVIHQTGVVGNYRWGRSRKRAILAWESAGQR